VTFAKFLVVLPSPTGDLAYASVLVFTFGTAVAIVCAAIIKFAVLSGLETLPAFCFPIAATLRDLRSVSIDHTPLTCDDGEGRIYGRLVVLPDKTQPLQRAQLVATISAGSEIRRIPRSLTFGTELDAALAAVGQGISAIATTWLAPIGQRLTYPSGSEPGAAPLQMRGNILAVSEALAQHSVYFDAGAPA
jgi:hypothetical protein